MIRDLIGTALAMLALVGLGHAADAAIWPSEPPLMIDASANAYAAVFVAKPKPPVVAPPAPPRAVPRPPRSHRLKTNMDQFNRFEFDQRTIV